MNATIEIQGILNCACVGGNQQWEENSSGRTNTKSVLMYSECQVELGYENGVIGIAGPRGIGKTRMLQEFCATTKKMGFFTYIFPSPKRYESREFVLSLYKELVSRHRPHELPLASFPLLWSKETWFKIQFVLFVFLAFLVIVTGIAIGFASSS